MLHYCIRQFADQFCDEFRERIEVFVSRCNESFLSTQDGIDVCGDRIVIELEDYLRQRTYLTQLSVIAHSLGGLFARCVIIFYLFMFWNFETLCKDVFFFSLPSYVIGQLYRRGIFHLSDSLTDVVIGSSCSLRQRLRARHFITCASPHLGSNQMTHFFGNWLVHGYTRLALGRTGLQLMLLDTVGRCQTDSTSCCSAVDGGVLISFVFMRLVWFTSFSFVFYIPMSVFVVC